MGFRKGQAGNKHLGKGRISVVSKQEEDTDLASPARMEKKQYIKDLCKPNVPINQVICNDCCGMFGID